MFLIVSTFYRQESIYYVRKKKNEACTNDGHITKKIVEEVTPIGIYGIENEYKQFVSVYIKKYTLIKFRYAFEMYLQLNYMFESHL